jgi:N-methylhydantoinase A
VGRGRGVGGWAGPLAVDFEALDRTELDLAFRNLEQRARDEVGDGDVEVHRAVFMRSVGQVHALEISLPVAPLDATVAQLPQLFRERYVEAYGVAPAPRVQLTALRVRVVRPAGAPMTTTTNDVPVPRTPEPVASRPAYFAEVGDFVPTPVFDWTALAPGDRVDGPAIVQAPDSTVVVPPERNAVVDPRRNLVLHR